MDQDNRNRQILSIAKDVLSAANHLQKADMDAKFAKDALLSNSKDEMVAAIHKCVAQYASFVNATTLFTGRCTHQIPDFYDDKNIEYVKRDVEFCIEIIYVKTAVDFGLQTVLEKQIAKAFGVH